jgi:phage antirepressor YoqD-like protein
MWPYPKVTYIQAYGETSGSFGMSDHSTVSVEIYQKQLRNNFSLNVD